MAEFTAHYERKYSDGNYGSEGLALSVTFDPDTDDRDPRWFAEDLRTMVLGFLAAHGSSHVAYAAKRELNPPAPRDPSAAQVSEDSEDLPF